MALKIWMLADLLAHVGQCDMHIAGPSEVLRELSCLPWLDHRTDRTHITLQSVPFHQQREDDWLRVVLAPYSAKHADVKVLEPTTAELMAISFG